MTNIRITADTSHFESDWSGDEDDQELIDYYINDVIPAAIQFVEKIIYVRAIDGSLTLERECEVWNDSDHTICSLLSSDWQQCGDLITIPEDAFDALTVCSVNNTNCTTYNQGSGYSNTDLVIFFSGTDHEDCDDLFGFSSFCHTNYYDRPIAGRYNLCRDIVTDQSYFTWEESVNIVVHEIIHILGFSAKGFAYFRYNDINRTVRTQRDGDGKPNYTVDVEGNINYDYGLNTIITSFIRSKTVTMIVLPTVIERAKEFFNCSTLIGIELEDTGSSSVVLSHLESRIFIWPLMGSWIAPESPLTIFTLAILADSGWYDINWDYTFIPPYGHNKGCSWLTEQCIDEETNSNIDEDIFCIEENLYSCGDDYTAKRKCETTVYSDGVPQEFQYYSDNTIGGDLIQMDYCPVYTPYSNGDCRDEDAGNPQTSFGGIICPQCKCNLMIAINDDNNRAICRQHQCIIDAFNLEYIGIRIGYYGSDNYDIEEWITCWMGDDDGTSKIVREYSSQYMIQCPVVSNICSSSNPWLCNGHGTYNHNTNECKCSQGYQGDKCKIQNRKNNRNNTNIIETTEYDWVHDIDDEYVGYVIIQIRGFNNINNEYNNNDIHSALKLLIAIPTNANTRTQIYIDDFIFDLTGDDDDDIEESNQPMNENQNTKIKCRRIIEEQKNEQNINYENGKNDATRV